MSELVTNEMVTRGALEARAWGVVSKHGEWTDSEAQQQCARDILESAAPLIAAKAMRDAVEVMRRCKDQGHWNLRDPRDPETSYSPDAWLSVYANRIERGEA